MPIGWYVREPPAFGTLLYAIPSVSAAIMAQMQFNGTITPLIGSVKAQFSGEHPFVGNLGATLKPVSVKLQEGAIGVVMTATNKPVSAQLLAAQVNYGVFAMTNKSVAAQFNGAQVIYAVLAVTLAKLAVSISGGQLQSGTLATTNKAVSASFNATAGAQTPTFNNASSAATGTAGFNPNMGLTNAIIAKAGTNRMGVVFHTQRAGSQGVQTTTACTWGGVNMTYLGAATINGETFLYVWAIPLGTSASDNASVNAVSNVGSGSNTGRAGVQYAMVVNGVNQSATPSFNKLESQSAASGGTMTHTITTSNAGEFLLQAFGCNSMGAGFTYTNTGVTTVRGAVSGSSDGFAQEGVASQVGAASSSFTATAGQAGTYGSVILRMAA